MLNFYGQDSVIKILDVFYRDRNYARFYVLETIARVPYFGKTQSFFPGLFVGFSGYFLPET